MSDQSDMLEANGLMERASLGLKLKVGQRIELSNGTSIIFKNVQGRVTQIVVCIPREVKLFRMDDPAFTNSSD